MKNEMRIFAQRIISDMRRPAVLFLATVFVLSACGSDGSPVTEARRVEIEKQVTAAFEGLVEAAKTLNPDAYFEYFDKERHTSLNENGTVTLTFDEFAESYRKRIKTFSKYESLIFKNVKITVIDENSALLVNEFDVKVALKSGSTVSAAGAGTQVWVKKDLVWRLVHISASSK